jgi:hypothetical protein
MTFFSVGALAVRTEANFHGNRTPAFPWVENGGRGKSSHWISRHRVGILSRHMFVSVQSQDLISIGIYRFNSYSMIWSDRCIVYALSNLVVVHQERFTTLYLTNRV